MVSDSGLDEIVRRTELATEGRRSVSSAEREAEEAAVSRRFITRTILWTWVGALCVYAAISLFAIHEPSAASIPPAVLDVIKTAVLPLTTLVLGYYMSRSK